jgi:hypothetical protein
MIVDGYCDVCGSPAGAPPYVPGAAVSAASPALAAEPDLTAVRRGVVGAATDVEMADTALAGPDDDDTVGMPRVVSVVSGGRHPLPQLPEQRQQVDPAAAAAEQIDEEQVHPAAADAEQADGAKELAEDEPDDAQDYRMRVEQAPLPDEVRKAALREVGNLERTSDQSPESGDIRSWLDTILDLPWSTKTTDSMDVQRARQVGPAAADTEKVDPTTDVEQADASPAGPNDDDTVGMPPVVAAPGPTGVQQWSGFPAKPKNGSLKPACMQPGCTGTIVDGYCDVCGSPAGAPAFVPAGAGASGPSPDPAHGPGTTAVRRGVAAVLFILGCAVVFYQVVPGFHTSGSSPSRTASSAPTAVASQNATPGGVSASAGPAPASDPKNGSAAEEAIQLENVADSARPFQTVRIQGTYRGGADTFVRVQRSEVGKWVTFPVPTKPTSRASSPPMSS